MCKVAQASYFVDIFMEPVKVPLNIQSPSASYIKEANNSVHNTGKNISKSLKEIIMVSWYYIIEPDRARLEVRRS